MDNTNHHPSILIVPDNHHTNDVYGSSPLDFMSTTGTAAVAAASGMTGMTDTTPIIYHPVEDQLAPTPLPEATTDNWLEPSTTSVPHSATAPSLLQVDPSFILPPPAKKARTEESPVLVNPNPNAQSDAVFFRKRVHNEQWEQMLEKLKNYKAQHGHCLVPKRYQADPKLGTWVETQRVQYKRLARAVNAQGEQVVQPNKRLTTERLQKLEELEFAWSAKHVRKKKDTFDALMPTPLAPTTMGRTRANAAGVTVAPTRTTATKWRDSQWEEMYARLKIFKDGHGHCLVPRKYETDPKLAAWVESQRVLWNRDLRVGESKLSLERKQRLDELGFVWSLRSKRIEDHWDAMFQQLLEYKEQHGDCLVPSRYEANLKLGKWVETQRYEYTKLQRAADPLSTEPLPLPGVNRPTNPRLTEDRLRRLEDIGFEWKVKNKMKRYYDKQWDAMFNRLLQFKQQYGHANVPKRYPEDVKLGTWVHTQRIQYRKIMGKKTGEMTTPIEASMDSLAGMGVPAGEEVTYRLTEERRQRLEQVGFCWSAREGEKGTEAGGRMTRNSYDDQWDTMFTLLQEYKAQRGDCLVPKRHQPNPKLGTWVDTQRVQYKKLLKKLAEQGKTLESDAASGKPLVGRLTNDRIRRLEALGFVWSLRDDWQKHYEELKAYKLRHGHCNVPARYSENRRLGIWVSAQRQQYKVLQSNQGLDKPRRSAPLTQERIELLDAIGFTWTIRSRDSLGESWNQRLEELKTFRAQHGHCLVPSRYEPNPELGVWVGTQRTQYRLYLMAKETGMAVTTSMNEERIRELEELGFVWALRGTVAEATDMMSGFAAI